MTFGTNLMSILIELQESKANSRINKGVVWKLAAIEPTKFMLREIDTYPEHLRVGVDQIPRKDQIVDYLDNRILDKKTHEAIFELNPQLKHALPTALIERTLNVGNQRAGEILVVYQELILQRIEPMLSEADITALYKASCR